jgi:hypothetical protein
MRYGICSIFDPSVASDHIKLHHIQSHLVNHFRCDVDSIPDYGGLFLQGGMQLLPSVLAYGSGSEKQITLSRFLDRVCPAYLFVRATHSVYFAKSP